MNPGFIFAAIAFAYVPWAAKQANKLRTTLPAKRKVFTNRILLGFTVLLANIGLWILFASGLILFTIITGINISFISSSRQSPPPLDEFIAMQFILILAFLTMIAIPMSIYRAWRKGGLLRKIFPFIPTGDITRLTDEQKALLTNEQREALGIDEERNENLN